MIKAAYSNLTPQEPILPLPNSPLPALLAIRATNRFISETKSTISTTFDELRKQRGLLAREESDLQDANLLAKALETRIANLQLSLSSQSQRSPEEAATFLMHDLQTKMSSYELETKKLIRALVRFINTHLAGMLAAEELGGPVVGELLDITDEMLEAGFSQQGKAKKPKGQGTIIDGDGKRQRRIDQIWGASAEGDNEREVAGLEFRSLVEELLNVAAEQGTGAYLTLSRDSAASRFLIRAKVAQFHPKDARKLRLIDFGRELDD